VASPKGQNALNSRTLMNEEDMSNFDQGDTCRNALSGLAEDLMKPPAARSRAEALAHCSRYPSASRSVHGRQLWSIWLWFEVLDAHITLFRRNRSICIQKYLSLANACDRLDSNSHRPGAVRSGTNTQPCKIFWVYRPGEAAPVENHVCITLRDVGLSSFVFPSLFFGRW
jgi:hypothetical protein